MTENEEPLVVRLDHLVLTVRDPQATVRFYEAVLGIKPVRFGEGRLALQFGNTKINLHQARAEIAPYALRPTPGSADLCLITEGPLDAVRRRLSENGVPIELGPVKRTGAAGPILSVYFRDPDGNLIEVSRYEDQAGS